MERQTPRERRRARTAQDILDAALEIIAERGVNALSMREIAQRIEYSPSGLYEYYASKDEILDALVEQGLAQLDRQIVHATHGDTAAQQLLECGLAYQAFAREHPHLYQLIFNHVARPAELQTSLRGFAQNAAYGKLRTCIIEGIERREFVISPESDVEQLVYYFWSLWHGLAMLRLSRASRIEDIDEINHQVIQDAITRLSHT
ncbi:MAG: TetR/AcrR family transcriptional regulator [Chloroflexi bacterium]|nr:TetR/AcrR family transcriptional regulator [Chloroflexota bacterium]